MYTDSSILVASINICWTIRIAAAETYLLAVNKYGEIFGRYYMLSTEKGGFFLSQWEILKN